MRRHGFVFLMAISILISFGAYVIKVNDNVNTLSAQMETKNEMLNKTMIEIYNIVSEKYRNSSGIDVADNQTSVGDLITQIEEKSKKLDELIIKVNDSIVKHNKFGKRLEKLENQVQNTSKIEFTDIYSDEWKPDIRAFYVPESVKSGENDFWVNCSLLGLTIEEVSQFVLILSKDNKIFYNIGSDFAPKIFPVSGLDTNQLEISNDYYGNVRIKHPTVEAKGVYRCTLTTTRRGESKTV